MANFAKARLDSHHILSFEAILISSIKMPSCTTLWFIIPKDVAYSISEIHSSLNLQHVFTLRAFRRNCLEKALWGACHNDAVLKNTQTTCGESLTTLLCFVFFPGLQAFCSPLLWFPRQNRWYVAEWRTIAFYPTVSLGFNFSPGDWSYYSPSFSQYAHLYFVPRPQDGVEREGR